MSDSKHKVWLATVIFWSMCVSGACIEDERTRPYEEFVAEYSALQVEDMTSTADAAPDLVMMPDMPDEPDAAVDMAFFIDPNDPPECSINGGGAVTVEFVNNTGQDIDLFWYNPVCAPIKYANIPDGGTHTQPTFVGHVWGWASEFATPFNDPARRAVIFDDAMTRVEFEEEP